MSKPFNKRLLSPLWGWDGFSAVGRLQVRPNARRKRAEIMKLLGCLTLFLFSGIALAGGDFVRGKLTGFSGESGNYSLTFEQSELSHELKPGCRVLHVEVSYEQVPRFSWLPFVHTRHPTKMQTDHAAEFLLAAYKEQNEIQFGYMGGGLVPTEHACSFSSKGLMLEEGGFVLSYSDRV